MARVALIGDFNGAVIAHQAIPKALRLASAAVEPVWVHTASIADPAVELADFDGIWCVPASPYANTTGALAAIRYAREQRRPFLGTCGGFQHAVLEYARNVCGLPEAAHAEIAPEAQQRVIAPLACSLVEKTEEILLAEDSLLRRAYGCTRAVEGYHFFVNPTVADLTGDGYPEAVAGVAAGSPAGEGAPAAGIAAAGQGWSLLERWQLTHLPRLR